MIPLFLNASKDMYYYYDLIKDTYVFVHRHECRDFRKCKPVYKTKGVVRHKKGYRLNPGNENGYDSIIKKACEKYKVDFYLVKSLIKAESLFDKNAVSTKGAMGLMQLMPATAKQMGVDDPFSPEKNIIGGTRLLKHLLGRFRNIKKALAAYNAGEPAVILYNGVPPYKETQNYVTKINKFYKKYTERSLW
ncbi:MAG: lytic transglycosylase domain-containing protein [bacterium]